MGEISNGYDQLHIPTHEEMFEEANRELNRLRDAQEELLRARFPDAMRQRKEIQGLKADINITKTVLEGKKFNPEQKGMEQTVNALKRVGALESLRVRALAEKINAAKIGPEFDAVQKEYRIARNTSEWITDMSSNLGNSIRPPFYISNLQGGSSRMAHNTEPRPEPAT